jgi:steroid 5-alpha reductase family enzyme
MKQNLVPIVGILVSVALAAGMSLAGGASGAELGGLPVFALCGLLAFAIQWVMFVPAYLLQTERFYDITGSVTYIAVAFFGLASAPGLDAPRILITLLVVAWAARLGTFLFARIRADREDVRFRHIKPHFLRFLLTWTLQGLWVIVTFAAGLAAVTSETSSTANVYTLTGVVIWLVGFVFEVVADQQKRRFLRDPANRAGFIQHGLWQYSRHPNYFGEIVLWVGIAVIAYPMLTGWQHLTLVSPLFVFLLLTRISGVNLLEAQGRKRWGDDAAYQAYCRRTPVLVPRKPGSGKPGSE